MSAEKLFRLPVRIFGPLEPAYVTDVVEDTLNDESLNDTLVRFLAGNIEPYELAYEVQIVMSANYQRRFKKIAEREGQEMGRDYF